MSEEEKFPKRVSRVRIGGTWFKLGEFFVQREDNDKDGKVLRYLGPDGVPVDGEPPMEGKSNGSSLHYPESPDRGED